MFAYCNNNPVGFVDSNGTYPEKPDIGPNGVSYAVEEKFRFIWGTVTVIASYEAKIVDGLIFNIDTIQINMSDSNLSVTMPDGTSFNYECDWTGIKPDSYTKTLSEELGLEMILDTDGLGLSITNNTLTSSFNLEIKVIPSLLLTAIKNVAGSLPPFGGSHGGGPWDMQNKTLLFK